MLRSDTHMENYKNFTTGKSKLNSASEISLSSFSQSQSSASIGGGGYASSLVASTIGSWDDEEQDYDEKSTKKVVEMMNQLENLLYQDIESNSSSPANNNTELVQECLQWSGLFPHIRIRATQIIPAKESSFQIISHQEVRSASPYFYIPAAPLSDLDTTEFSVSGIPVTKPFKPNTDSLIDPASFKDDENNLPQTELDWFDEKVQSTIPALKSRNLEWAVFKIVEEVIVNERSTTPTQDNPEPKSDSVKQFRVKLISTSAEKRSSQFKKEMCFQSEKEVCVFGIENCKDSGFLLAHSIGQNSLYTIEYVDFAVSFQDVALYHHQHATMARFTSDSVVEQIYTHQQNTVSNGQIDEYFAFDDRDSSTKGATENHNPIKEDLIHSIFDDLWSEIYPKFQGIVSKLTDDLTSSKAYSVVSTASLSPNDSEEEEEDEISGFDLLSAITIKPIPLQKRDMAATLAARRVIDNPPSPEPAYYLHTNDNRPSSAKPNLGFSGRPSRPTSAKPQDMYARLQTPVKFTSRQVLRTHHRLLPLANTQAQISGASHGLNEAMYVTSMAKPNSHWEPRPATSSNMSKKLPPLRGIITAANADLPENTTSYSTKIQRHVAFDQASSHQAESAPKRETSPRPFSASRRPITGNLRSRTTFSRPHTAISESLSKLASHKPAAATAMNDQLHMNSKVMHLNGTAFGKASHRSYSNYYK